jgi:hypothetical protein
MSGTSRFSEAFLFLFLCACGAAGEDGAPGSTLLDSDSRGDEVAPASASTGTQPPGPPAPPPKPPLDPMTLRPAYTEYLGKLTGSTLNPMYPGAVGTDLGITFERDGQLVFLFGDSLAPGGVMHDVDLAATAPLTYPTTGLPKLTWHSQMKPPGIQLGMMNVPVEGVAVGNDTFVFFVTKFDKATNTYGGAAITKTTGLALDQLQVLSEVPPGNFANVSVIVENGEAFIYGTSGLYRQSAVYLARVPVAQLADRSAWKIDPNPIIDVDCAGELSVRKHPKLALYLATFGCDEPRGANLRIAAKPEGPWIEAGRIFTAEDGYERFIHANESFVGYDDGLAPRGDENNWGGEYGPYLIPQWFTQDGDKFGIVYTMSSWIPYQVHLMRTWLVPPTEPKTPPAKGAGLTKAKLVNGDFASGDLTGWLASGDGATFGVFTGADGKMRVTTYTPAKGDAATGSLAQAFVVDATTSSLSFALHGGDARVIMKHGDEIVRESRGRRNATSEETNVKWNLTPFRGETVTLVIEDDLTGAWGFVGARDFVLQ